ncbi:hypothetical protein Lal_00007734 [Lupinus albus]|uniref:DUF7054 domain-containing protein n=1 Tax=Lupinus albus TaxID=3870 RepID=A0A6A5MRE4_LUPAL|nr:hypothetical protein Lalb_Chr16g0379801 [Lupinus albus]KAF1875118.1 hypothetical protein Lal_00007734 [Lupinus albus]
MGGFVSIPRTQQPIETTNDSLRPSKLLFNVTIHNSLGTIKVLMLPEDNVGDLIKAVLVIYDGGKMRPVLRNIDPNCYHLHYSPYNLQSLKPSEKLKNLGSRNFFLCSKPRTSSR